MLDPDEYRVIPGYEAYGVNHHGIVVSFETRIILNQYFLNGYLMVDTFRGSLTETLPVHRAVALAWVPNPDPIRFTVVNHLDGVILNNDCRNLEWTDYSGNNYHAVNNGLRSDNIPCRIRDFETGQVHEFMSIRQASKYMGFVNSIPFDLLKPKKFGALIAGRYEFRYWDDPTPWFYEGRSERVSARYQVVVTEPDGTRREVYSNRAMLREYQLYDSPKKSIPELVNYANSIYPDRLFEYRDSYATQPYRVEGSAKRGTMTGVLAVNGETRLEFRSLNACARHFKVDRSTITNRLNTDKTWNGWTFTSR